MNRADDDCHMTPKMFLIYDVLIQCIEYSAAAQSSKLYVD